MLEHISPNCKENDCSRIDWAQNATNYLETCIFLNFSNELSTLLCKQTTEKNGRMNRVCFAQQAGHKHGNLRVKGRGHTHNANFRRKHRPATMPDKVHFETDGFVIKVHAPLHDMYKKSIVYGTFYFIEKVLKKKKITSHTRTDTE